LDGALDFVLTTNKRIDLAVFGKLVEIFATKNLEANGIYQGNPALLVKSRKIKPR